jgi:YVTN family beta-propeller protein
LNSIAAKFGLGFGRGRYLQRQMAVSPDGRKIYELNDYSVSVVGVASNTVPTTIKVGDPVDLALTSNGAKLFVVNQLGNSVSVIDVSSNTVTATIPVEDWPYHTLISPDDSTLFVAHFSGDRLVSMIDTRTNSIVAKIEVGGWFCGSCAPESMAITPDGRKLYVAVPESRSVAVIDIAKRRQATTINVGLQKLEDNSMAMTSDGRTLYVSPGSGTISAIDTASDAVVATLPADGALSLTADGRKLYAVGSAVSVIDTASNKVIASIPVSGFGKMVFANTPSP